LGGTLVSLWPGKKSDAEAETKVAEAKAVQAAAALTKSEQARQAAEAKAADAEKARQAIQAKADDADKARLAAFARAEDADRARRAAEARAADSDKSRLAAEVKAAPFMAAPSVANDPRPTTGANPAAIATNGFTRRPNMEAKGKSTSPFSYDSNIVSAAVCEQICARSNSCNVYTYNKDKAWCFKYSAADLVPNDTYDSGIRQ
jgi:hypothetical protein